MAEIVALGSAQAQFMYSNQSIANSGANVKPSGPEVLVFTVSVGGEMTAIIKIACGVVKFQMAKLCPSETVTIWEGRRRLRIWGFRRPGGNGMELASSDAMAARFALPVLGFSFFSSPGAAVLFFLYKEKEKNGGAKKAGDRWSPLRFESEYDRIRRRAIPTRPRRVRHKKSGNILRSVII